MGDGDGAVACHAAGGAQSGPASVPPAKQKGLDGGWWGSAQRGPPRGQVTVRRYALVRSPTVVAFI